ncbi:MAG: hypothetical protein R8K50_03185 [Mariprofundus sp.]
MPMALYLPSSSWWSVFALVIKDSSLPKLELDQPLRLLPQLPDLGTAALLTDALVLPFTDIENRLARLALGTSEADASAIRSSMKAYLGRLNSNAHIPLKFRLKVLSRFEQDLSLFDGEMTAAVLNAHKIAVLLVRDKARDQPSYYQILIDMVANAIELSVNLLRLSLSQYRTQSILATRQFFDLARLGLDVAAGSSQSEATMTARLHLAICNHELLRCMDFFSTTPSMQERIWLELQHHIEVLRACYCPQDSALPGDIDGAVLLINLNRPNNAGTVCLKLNETLPYDAILIPIKIFHDRLQMAADHATHIIEQPSMQKQALHTEQELENTRLGCTQLLRALTAKERVCERKDQAKIRIALQVNAVKAIQKAFAVEDSEWLAPPANQQSEDKMLWHIANLHANGICLERIDSDKTPQIVGALVGLDWLLPEEMPDLPFNQENPKLIPKHKYLGIVRWLKIVKHGEQRLGIEFIHDGFQLATAMMQGGGYDAEQIRTWPVLLRLQPGKRSMLLPQTGIYRNMTLMLSLGSKQAHFKVSAVEQAALNYSSCLIVPANATNSKSDQPDSANA